MNKKNWNGVDIDEQMVDGWIKELSENKDEYFRLCGNKLVLKDGNRIYICKLEQTVDLSEKEMHKCTKCKMEPAEGDLGANLCFYCFD